MRSRAGRINVEGHQAWLAEFRRKFYRIPISRTHVSKPEHYLNREGVMSYEKAITQIKIGNDSLALKFLITALSQTTPYAPGERYKAKKSSESYRYAEKLLDAIITKQIIILQKAIGNETLTKCDPDLIKDSLKILLVLEGILDSNFKSLQEYIGKPDVLSGKNSSFFEVYRKISGENGISILDKGGKKLIFDSASYNNKNLEEWACEVRREISQNSKWSSLFITNSNPDDPTTTTATDTHETLSKPGKGAFPRFYTLMLPESLQIGTEVPDLSTVSNLEVSFPDFEVLGFDSSIPPSTPTEVAIELSNCAGSLNPVQIEAMAESIKDLQGGTVTILISGDNLPPRRIRVSTKQLIKEILPLLALREEHGDNENNGNSGGNGDNQTSLIGSDGKTDSTITILKHKLTDSKISKKVRRGTSVQEKPQARVLISCSFPDLETLGYSGVELPELGELFTRLRDKIKVNTPAHRAFNRLFKSPKKVIGTLTYSAGNKTVTEKVEWTYLEYRKQFSTRLRKLYDGRE